MPNTWILISLGGLLMSGCYFTQSAKAPVNVDYHRDNGPTRARGLVVFLPGMFDGPGEFERYGFVDQVREVAPDYDSIAVNLHFHYYSNGSFARRLHDDVVVPARRFGYRKIWLVGISMGGFGALGFTKEYPDLVDGVIALAPFLGDRWLIDEVAEAGGVCEYRDSGRTRVGDEIRFYRSLWTWFAELCRQKGGGPELYLAYGRDDRVARAAGLLEPALPQGHIQTRAGGHKWSVWRPLFAQLSRRVLPGAQPGR